MTTALMKRSNRWTAGPALAVALRCLLAYCAATTGRIAVAQDQDQVRTQRQQQIEALSEIERSRLQRNFSEFRSLPEADREKLRQLDRNLKENDRNDGGSLRKVMEDYCNWLSTISISQREELRKTIDPKEREKLVREIRKEQESATRPESFGPGRGGPKWAGLSREDLDSVMKSLEKNLREQLLSPQEIEDLDKRNGMARYAFLLDLLVKHEAPAIREAFERRAPFQPRTPLPIIEELTSAVSSQKEKKFLLALTPGERLRHLARMIWVGIRAEYARIKPTEQQLEEFFIKQKASQQDELMRLPTEQMQQRLTWMFMQEHPEKYPPLPREIFGLFPMSSRSQSPREGGPDNDPRRKQFGPMGEPGERRGPSFRGEKGVPPKKDGESGPPT